MRGTFTQSLFFTLFRASLALLSGLLLWVAAAATSDVHIQPITVTITLLVIGSFSFMFYPVLRRLQRGNDVDGYKLSFPQVTLFIVGGILSCSTIQAQVSGAVFRDFNANGMKDNSASYNETFVSGVVVKAYNSSNVEVGSQTTTSTGTYSFTGLTLPLRIEFSGLTVEDYPAPAGTSNASSVQFYTNASTTANYGINYPQHYTSNTNPDVVVSQFEANRPPSSEPLATAMLKTPYNSRGQTWPANTTSIAKTSDIGGTWGLAYNRASNEIYAASLVKRHAAMKDNDSNGKEDIGAIYSITPSGTTSLWLDVASLGVDVGLTLMPTIATRALPTMLVAPSHDALMYPLVGKIGLGDIEISDDYSKLYFVNLHDKKVYTVDIATKTLIGTGIDVPSPCNAGSGTVRPFGLKFHRGKLYVGAVCDAFTSQAVGDLSASVYRLDGASFTSILNFPLNYLKGYAFKDLDGNSAEYGKAWTAWTDVLPPVSFTSGFLNSEVLVKPQPMLVNMEFDIDESLILTFNDRLGHQGGQVNYGTNTANTTTFYTVLIGGDILRASLVGGVYTLESNGSAGGVTTAGAGNNEGPGGGEFYIGDRSNLESTGRYHNEDIIGGSTFFAGRSEVAVLVTDPIDYFAGGVYFFDNTTGDVVAAANADRYQLYPFTTDVSKFGKANGLGDMEIISGAAPLEIGNRVWMDTDNDGIQDADEMGIGSIPVKLYQGATQVGATTTATDGTFYFNNSNVNLNSATGLLPNTAYIIRVDAADFPAGKSLSTNQNIGGAGQPDVRDNDATLNAGNAEIAVTTGNYGENNHTLDMAFRLPPCALTAISFANAGTCNDNGTNTNATDDYFTADITVTFSNPPATGNLVLTGDVLAGGGATTVTVATAGAGPTYTFVGVRLRADGTASAVTATFSADNACTFSVTNGPNVPSCSNCIVPVLATNNGAVCIGNSVSLVTLVTGNSPAGTLTFHTSQSDATAGTNALVNSTVAPIANTTYYVRSETAVNCFSTTSVSVTVVSPLPPTVTNGSVCVGGSIDLATLVTSTGGGTLSFYTSQANANAGTNALGSSTVSPTTATNYYVRSTAAGCYGVKEITVTIAPVACGTPTATGPN